MNTLCTFSFFCYVAESSGMFEVLHQPYHTPHRYILFVLHNFGTSHKMFIRSSYYYLVKDVTHNVKDEHWWRSKLWHTDSTGSGLLIWNPGHHEVKYFPLFNHTQYPWLPCIFSFKHFLSLVLDFSTNNHGIRNVLKWRAAKKFCWKACGVNPHFGCCHLALGWQLNRKRVAHSLFLLWGERRKRRGKTCGLK